MKKLLFIVLGMALGFTAQSLVVISLEDGSVSPKLASTAIKNTQTGRGQENRTYQKVENSLRL